MSKNIRLLDLITIISFGVGLYALYIALLNLEENREQESELVNILDYLENHLEVQDKILINITGGNND